jgi:hypothetical protein
LVLGACGDETCDLAAATEACRCVGGASGVQSCQADGTWAACVCVEADGGRPDTTDGGRPDTSPDAGATTPDTGDGGRPDTSPDTEAADTEAADTEAADTEAADTGAEDDGAADRSEPDTGTEFSEYDDFDEDNIVWLHTDVSDWEVTSTVTSAHINYEELCVYHTMAGQWPEVLGIFREDPDAPMEGNIWIIARIDGVWYAATFDYLRPGGQCKYDGYSPEDEGPGPSTFGAVPLSTWSPRSGEPVYLFVSTIARHEPLGPVHERSDFVELIWP